MIQIPGCSALRTVDYRLEFPNASCPPTTPPPAPIRLIVETGSTAFDAMIAAADRNRAYNFKTSYFGDSGFFIDSVSGTASTSKCFWFFFYTIPGVQQPIPSQLGVSNVVVPGDGFGVILSYQSLSGSPGPMD